MSTPAAYFDEMHQSADPWGFRQRWYEERKRTLLLAMLPSRRYNRAWEVGCSTGELSAGLASRCDVLLATDGCTRAVESAAERLRAFPHVAVEKSTQPDQWPEGAFDLIVFSEVGYFLGRRELERCVQRFSISLADDGILIASHWRRSFDIGTMEGDEVHRLIDASLPLESFMVYEDADVVVQGWSRGELSVAALEGIA